MERRVITSTSRSSAMCSDLILRGGSDADTIRLIFKPELVNNPRDASAAVRGTFVYQRKGATDTWTDTTVASLARLKKGEGYQLELKAGECLKLSECLNELYKLYEKEGIPFGQSEYVRADSIIASLMDLPRSQLRTYLTANRTIGEDLLSRLLGWASELQEPSLLVSRLVSLGESALRNINVAVGLSSLKYALNIWDENRANANEEFWQKTLTENSFVLEHVFSWPTTIVKGKAFMGGKSAMDIGGNIVDFLVKNYLTNNAALVEIKTPKTRLLARRYRGDVYNISEDLGGAVMQVLNYRFNLQREFWSLSHGVPGAFEAFEPRCVVIVGSTEELERDEDKTRALELFRGCSSDVAVITFDELFEKTRRLVNVLEAVN